VARSARTTGFPLRDAIRSATEIVVGWALGVISLVLQFALYAAAVLALPVGPFLLPLALAPVVLLFGLPIVWADKILGALGLL
jgi:hypothetical protein